MGVNKPSPPDVKGGMSRRKFLELIRDGFALAALAACQRASGSTPTVASNVNAATRTPNVLATPGAILRTPTVAPIIESTESPDKLTTAGAPPKVSAIKNLYLGQGEKGSFIGQVKGNDTQINTLFSPDKPKVPAGFGIDQEFLISLFKAQMVDGVMVGETSNKVKVALNKGIWRASTGEIFIPFFAPQRGSDAQYLVIDKSGRLQEVDVNGNSIGTARPMFETPQAVAGRFKVPNANLAIGVEFTTSGALSFVSKQAKPTKENQKRTMQIITEVDFLGPREDLSKNQVVIKAVGDLAKTHGVNNPDDIFKSMTRLRLKGKDSKEIDIVVATLTGSDIEHPLAFSTETTGLSEVGQKDIWSRLNIMIGDTMVYIKASKNGQPGVYLESPKYHETLAKNYSVLTIAQGNYWDGFERKKGEAPNEWSEKDIKYQINAVKKMKQTNPDLRVRVHPLASFPQSNPKWLVGLSVGEAKAALSKHIQDVVTLYKNNGITPDEYVVVNEPYISEGSIYREDTLHNILGDDYIASAFKETRRIVGDKPLLIYNDTANNSLTQREYSYYTKLTKINIGRIKAAGVQNIAVGMQMQLEARLPFDKEDFKKTMQWYGTNVVITELAVDGSGVDPQKRQQRVADVYCDVASGAIESGVCLGVSTWNGVDEISDPVDYRGKADAAPTLFINPDDPQKKLAYYAVLARVFSYLT